MFHSLANRLTASRIAVIPVILLLLAIHHAWSAWVALVLFVAAGITDWLDGYIARRDHQVSMIGQFLDPIADKLLVAAVILLLVYSRQIDGFAVIPAVIILLREVAVSGLREFLAGVRVSVPVSQLAKWKTFIQIVALSFLIIGDRYTVDAIPATFIGDLLLWIAGMLTLFTAWDYWHVSQKHFRD
ncbi:MAG TPA: CDP-diacylglycerol--glycerol-3-phosphate 3-phosphatidyltransferase [Alphaproteobacteria bacterium]|nr:CDP-diacylglycerol--glycerol-3-phosphate 3-phosphatidyltransferase [Alphaproteobacteria bacterium]